MILRVFLGSAGGADRERVVAHLRDGVFASVAGMHGLHSFQTGIRELDGGRLEFVLVSTWADFDDLMASLGPDLDHPAWLRGVDDRIRPERADQFELVGEELRGVIPLSGGRLSVSRGTLVAGTAESFFDTARAWQTDLLDRGLVLASHIGRRMDRSREEAIAVAVRAAEDGDGADLALEPLETAWRGYFSDLETATYDALAQVPANPHAVPAVLLADDERRYIFATPAAGRLLGRPVARLIGRRVEEVTGPDLQAGVADQWASFITDGRQAGVFTVVRDDGSLAEVSFEARANTPWPGCHATVLGDAGAAVNLDEALAAAGLIARYVTAGA
jgi:PAS domain-containing protein